MNEVYRAITERYTCRDFEPTPLTDGQIAALSDAALASPSGGNRQPWRVVVITNKEIIEEIDAEAYKVLAGLDDKMYYERVKGHGGRVFYDAPYLMVILGDGSTWSSLDCGILCQNVVLTAHSLGLGSCIVGLAGMALNGPRKEDFRKRLGFPDGFEFAIGVLIGTVKTGKEPHEWEPGKITYIK